MKKITLAIAAFITVSTAGTAQNWTQLPWYYSQGGNPKIFASRGDTLVAGNAYDAQHVSVSTDGGTNWQEIFTSKPVMSAEFGPDGEMYLLTSKRYLTTSTYYPDTLYASANGLTWNVIGKIQDIAAARDEGDYTISANNTLCFPYQMNYSAGETYLSLSTNNGSSWTNPGYSGDISSIACSTTADTIVIGTTGNGVRYSHDGGITFNNATGGNWGASTVGGMAWLPNGDVYAAGPGQVYKSTDGGMTFTNLSPNPWIPLVINEFIYAPNGMFYVWGPNGIYESADCITWTNLTGNLPDPTQMRDMDVSNGFLYAVTDTNLYRMALSTGIAPVENSVLNISLFPNPSTGKFVVRCDEGIAIIAVTDVCGRTVQQIIAPGTCNEVELNLSEESAGIYYLAVESADGRVTVQRILRE